MNAEHIARDVVVIGASAGGVEALIQLVSMLPADFTAIVGVVLHRNPAYESRLAVVLGRRCALPVSEPADGDALSKGRVYLAPRDHHMLIQNGFARLNREPKEHRTRPAIDPLFRSAAACYGPRVVGVLLSGLGDDGVSGLIAITSAGGLSLVQDPREAMYPNMPRNALVDDDVDAVLPIADLVNALTVLARGGAVEVQRRAIA